MKKIKIIVIYLFMMQLLCLYNANADIILKTVITNPSSEKTKTVPIKSYLPKGIQPENIIDKDDFDIGYDFEKALYYLYQTIELPAKESRTMQVKIEDVWLISEDELSFLKNHLAKIMTVLEKTEYSSSVKTLGDSIYSRLEQISATQAKTVVNVEEHISRYEESQQILKRIKKDLASLEELIIEYGEVMPDKRLVGEIYEEGKIIGFQEKDLDIENLKTIKWNVSISNPSEKAKTVFLKQYFPAELKPDYVVDNGGFEIVYDIDKKLYYVYKENLELEPEQTMQFILEIKDVWSIPEKEINYLESHGLKMMEQLKGSAFYETGLYLSNSIVADLKKITAAQNLTGLTQEEHIANYRLNLEKLNNLKKDLAKLEKLFVQAGGSLVSLVQKQAGKFSIDERIKMTGKSIFRGKMPSVSVTWSIIYIIIGFLAVISGAFFILQLIHHKQVITDTLTGAYTRKYVTSKLPQELNRDKTVKYAILMIDIDGFKDFNDRYGHLVGDTILREIVSVLKKNLRAIDILSRMGGDEFLIGLPNKDKKEAQIVGGRLVKAVAIHRIRARIGAEELFVTLSIGIAVFPEDADNYEALVGKADEALYRAKGKGGNSVFVYGT
ncbi:MAG: GGDEF domain-containing protein [Candidatus Omnitrophota bacterium]